MNEPKPIVKREYLKNWGMTRLYVFPDESYLRYVSAHQIFGSDFDIDDDGKRIPPAVKISLLGTQTMTASEMHDHTNTMTFIASLADELQRELTAQYQEKWGNK